MCHGEPYNQIKIYVNEIENSKASLNFFGVLGFFIVFQLRGTHTIQRDKNITSATYGIIFPSK